MRIVPALEYEKMRQDESSWNKVILHKDGKFYHAYEWSAWLIKQVVCTEEFQKERGDEKFLIVNRYIGKKTGEYAMLGFPVESLSKYVPTYKDVRKLEEDDLEIEIDLTLDDGIAFEDLKHEFEDWKGQCPVNESKKGGKHATDGISQSAVLGRSGLFQIIAQIMSYPVERSTPAENIEFISKIKQDIARLL